jgi:electron transfer flavoprotein alpha/beta subunit
LDDVTAEEWNRLEEGQLPSYMKKAIGAYDESALELALRLAEEARAMGREAELTALTVDEDMEDHAAKNLFAAGYARVVQVTCSEDLRFRPDLTADLLCGFTKHSQKEKFFNEEKNLNEKKSFDWILTGQQANVGDNGQTHLLMAEKLGIPCILNVIDASCLKDSCLEEGVRVVSLVDEGVLEQTVTPPAVLAVANAAHPYLRVPTLRERMAASQKKVLVIAGETLVSPDSPNSIDSSNASAAKRLPQVVHRGLTVKKLRRECRFVPGKSPEEKARLLYDSCLAKVLKS